MIFLMNDAVLDVDMRRLNPPVSAGRFRALQLPFVLDLGRELFAARPRLQHEDPDRAARLAMLIVCKAPHVNAALFVAPAAGCEPAQVDARVADINVSVMAAMFTRQRDRALTPAQVDAEVWRRMAA